MWLSQHFGSITLKTETKKTLTWIRGSTSSSSSAQCESSSPSFPFGRGSIFGEMFVFRRGGAAGGVSEEKGKKKEKLLTANKSAANWTAGVSSRDPPSLTFARSPAHASRLGENGLGFQTGGGPLPVCRGARLFGRRDGGRRGSQPRSSPSGIDRRLAVGGEKV